MSLNKTILALFIVVLTVSTSACGNTNPPTPTSPALISTPTCTPTNVPTIEISPTPSSVEYTARFLDALAKSDASCLPAKTKDDVGVYIYDLNKDRELVSINADVPFQFASAIKAPVLTYFLSTCQKIWNPESPEWNAYFADVESAQNVERYVGAEYKQLIAAHISDINNWNNIETFFVKNKFPGNGVELPVDKRYFVLNQVYNMIARSSNIAMGEVLHFVYDHCQTAPQTAADKQRCGGPNAITAFNAWFNDFSQSAYQEGELRRGLYKWDVVLEKKPNGQTYEVAMPTYGLKDKCAKQITLLNCFDDGYVKNVLSARDFFKFYYALYHWDDEQTRRVALNILKIDDAGPARGDLKNLSRGMNAVAMSKNGFAFFLYGAISDDAGILDYQGNLFIVATLSFDAPKSIAALYGAYNSRDATPINRGLIQNFLEEYVANQR